MTQVVRTIYRSLLAVVVIVTVSILVDGVALYGPSLMERVFAASTKKTCQIITKEMNEANVLATIDSDFPAPYQVIRGDTLEFSRGNDVCKIEFDPVSAKATSVQFEPAGRSVWDISGADSNPED